MKVGIVSDTHGYIDDRVIQAVHGCDLIIHAGDVMAGSVLDKLDNVCDRLVVVGGNNDVPGRWIRGDHERLADLPASAEVELPGGILAVEHGHRHGFHEPCHKALRRAHAHARAVIYGHTHHQVIEQTESPWILNPGAAGRIRAHGGPGCLLLSASRGQWHIESRRFAIQAA